MPLHMLVSGPKACFPRREFSRDLVTYDAITPLAARTLFDRLYRPARRHWEVQRIELLKPVERDWDMMAERDGGRRILALRDVAYRLSATLLDTSGRDHSADHATAFAARLDQADTGQTAYLGLRQFAARICPAPPRSSRGQTGRLVDLGWMPFDTAEGREAVPLYFHAVAIDGVIDLTQLGPASLAI